MRKIWLFCSPKARLQRENVQPHRCGKSVRQMFWAAFSHSQRTDLAYMEGDSNAKRGRVTAQIYHEVLDEHLPMCHGGAKAKPRLPGRRDKQRSGCPRQRLGKQTRGREAPPRPFKADEWPTVDRPSVKNPLYIHYVHSTLLIAYCYCHRLVRSLPYVYQRREAHRRP